MSTEAALPGGKGGTKPAQPVLDRAREGLTDRGLERGSRGQTEVELRGGTNLENGGETGLTNLPVFAIYPLEIGCPDRGPEWVPTENKNLTGACFGCQPCSGAFEDLSVCI